MTLLCTGYEPFGDHEANPSAQVARELDGVVFARLAILGVAIRRRTLAHGESDG